MINHARTLLLNIDGPHLPSKSIAGDEYVPPYEAMELPSNLKLVHDMLFGVDPDYRGRVYRAAEYMKVLHKSGYDEYVYKPDPRITYPTANSTTTTDGIANFTPAYFSATITGGRQFGVTGEWLSAGYDGRVEHTWVITAIDAANIYVQNKLTGAVAYYNLNDTKVLPGADLRLTTTVTALTPGKDWTVVYRARPRPSLGVVLAALHALPLPAIQAVFGAARTEPALTFYNLFTKNDMLPQQLAGFLLAFIYKLDAMRLEE